MLVDQREHGGNHRLDRACRRPQPERDRFQRPGLAETGDNRIRVAAVGVEIEQPAMLGGEDLRSCRKALLGEERGQQTGQ